MLLMLTNIFKHKSDRNFAIPVLVYTHLVELIIYVCLLDIQ